MSSNARRAKLRAEREAQEAAEQAERSRKDAECRYLPKSYRYLPKSHRTMDELTELVGRTQAELIKTLIEDMIAEAREPYNGA